MKKKMIIGIMAFGLVTGFSSLAAHKFMTACKEDFKKFKCETANELQAHECLEKHENESAKFEGLTQKCYEAHKTYAHNDAKGHEGHEEGEEHHE